MWEVKLWMFNRHVSFSWKTTVDKFVENIYLRVIQVMEVSSDVGKLACLLYYTFIHRCCIRYEIELFFVSENYYAMLFTELSSDISTGGMECIAFHSQLMDSRNIAVRQTTTWAYFEACQSASPWSRQNIRLSNWLGNRNGKYSSVTSNSLRKKDETFIRTFLT